MFILWGEIKKQRDLEYLNLVGKRIIQRIPLNHCTRFNLNDVKVLEH